MRLPFARFRPAWFFCLGGLLCMSGLRAEPRHFDIPAQRADLALAALEGDDGKDADLIRADIFWKDEDWIRSGIVLRRIIAARVVVFPDPVMPVTSTRPRRT